MIMSPAQAIDQRLQYIANIIDRQHTMKSNGRYIIVIGASAGGVQALCAVASTFPTDMPAAVFVVLHVPPWRNSFLPPILSRCSNLSALHPKSGDVIEHGRIYVAPPD